MNDTASVHQQVNESYARARAVYAQAGIDADAALVRLAETPVSIHCWQGDDVHGLEQPGAGLSGGIMATGNYPGAARNGDELRDDMLKTFSLVPGSTRANIHAFYCEPDTPVERDQLEPVHFTRWMDWSRHNSIPLDFNPTFFSHPKAADGLTLTHPDDTIRKYWIRHGIVCRRIAEAFARNQDSPCICNFWIPDGCKDSPVDRWSPRGRLVESYDTIFDPGLGIDNTLCIDSVESKLFGIGSESYVAGSHEFYLGYVLTRHVIPCLDMGHFHPTETVDDKLSALLQYTDRLLLHLSRGIRWDSDHAVLFTDDLKQVFHELVRGNALDRVYIALDFFDASINRIGAWVIGARAVMQAILYALLEPVKELQEYEARGDGAGKLALLERMKTMPFGGVWDQYCLQQNVSIGMAWLDEVKKYEKEVLLKRGI
jgi:L-rhamnose isomerase